MPVLECKSLRATALPALLLLALSGCMPYNRPVARLDATGQKFASVKTVKQAVVRTAKTVPLARYRELAVISPPDCRINADEVAQLKEIGYFDEVIGQQSLPAYAAERHLPGIDRMKTWGDYQAFAEAYKPFLVIKFECIRKGDIWYRLTVTDAETLCHLFVSEIRVWTQAAYMTRSLLSLGGGQTVDNDCVAADEDARLPLYNALLEWLNANR